MSLLVPLRRSRKFSGCSYKPFTTPNNFSVFFLFIFFLRLGFFFVFCFGSSLADTCATAKSPRKKEHRQQKDENSTTRWILIDSRRRFGGWRDDFQNEMFNSYICGGYKGLTHIFSWDWASLNPDSLVGLSMLFARVESDAVSPPSLN